MTGSANKELGVARSGCLQGRCADLAFDVKASRQKIKEPTQALYQHYSLRNAHPSVTEFASIAAVLKEASSTASVITDIVTRLRAEIDVLEAEKNRINEVVLKYKSILRPVLRLPPELLARIFSFCVEIPELYDHTGRRVRTKSSLYPPNPSWVLSQVCQSFRKLALATPSLWSFVSFEFPAPPSPADPESLARLRAHNHRLRVQLQRSSNHPLTIITHTTDSKAMPSDIDRSLFQLCSHAKQWRSLRIDIHPSTIGELSQIRGSLENLESLDIHYPGSGSHEALDCFEFAPNLKKLVLSGNPSSVLSGLMGGPDSSFKIPHSHILDYTYYDDVAGNAPTTAWPILALTCFSCMFGKKATYFLHSRSLKPIYDSRISAVTNGRDPSITRHYLAELELSMLDPDNPTLTIGVDELLYRIRAPVLTKLTITTSGSDRTALLKFLSHCPSGLTSLTIHRIGMSSEEFSTVMAQLTSLKDLAFGVSGGISTSYLSLFQDLQETSPNGFSFVPELQSLALLPVPGARSSYSREKLLDMLEVRRKVPKSDPGTVSKSGSQHVLQSIKLDQNLEGEFVNARLDQLRADGLIVL